MDRKTTITSLLKLLGVLLVLMIHYSCVKKGLSSNEKEKYSIVDLYNLIETQKTFLYENSYDTLFQIDTLFSDLATYRAELIQILKRKKISGDFNKGMLIEEIGWIPNNKELEFYYWVIYYHTEKGWGELVTIDITNKRKNIKFKNYPMDEARMDKISKLLNNVSSFSNIPFKNGKFNEMCISEHYIIFSKMNENNKFCTLFPNRSLFWPRNYENQVTLSKEDEEINTLINLISMLHMNLNLGPLW